MSGTPKKETGFCYIDHETGDSDHMNAHLRTSKCDTPTRCADCGGNLKPSEMSKWCATCRPFGKDSK